MPRSSGKTSEAQEGMLTLSREPEASVMGAAFQRLQLLDLFNGIGAFNLGLEKSGLGKTVGFVELDPHAQAVLRRHWPDVPIHGDITTREFHDVAPHWMDRVRETGNTIVRLIPQLLGEAVLAARFELERGTSQ